MDASLTSEIRVKKVSLVKVAENGTVSKEKVSGLEWGPPTLGLPYVVYVGKGKYLKTSAIKDVKEIHNALMFKTVNSIYRIEYMKKEKALGVESLTQTTVNWR